MDALVTAGGTPEPGEYLYEYTQGKPKALLDICGKPMLQWVLDALTAAREVERIVLIGLTEDSGVTSPKIGAFLPNQGSMLKNFRVGMDKVVELNPQASHILLVSSDIPGITPAMVDWTIQTAMLADRDAYYFVIERKVMEGRYPASKRSYVKFKDMEVCGADMNVVPACYGTQQDGMWEKILNARKSAMQQASLIGYDVLILMLLRAITLDQAVKKVARRLHLNGAAIPSPYAEIGMDVDKPFQLEIMREDLAKRLAG